MFNSITKIFKKDPREVAINEAKKIMKLREKLEDLDVQDEIQKEIKSTQLEVLRNNFSTVAHTFELKNESGEFLNLQGTSKKLYKIGKVDTIYFKESALNDFSPRTIDVDPGLTSKLDFELEKKFMKLKPEKLKTNTFQKIRNKVQEKVKKATIKLVQDTPYNEDVFYRFIIDNLDDHPIFDIDDIEKRYDFVYYLLTEYKWDDDWEIQAKDILVFDQLNFSYMHIDKLLNELKTKRYDFAVRDHNSMGVKSFRKWVE
jgi:hypothetical protein